MDTDTAHSIPADEAIAVLATNATAGLGAEEVARRRKEYGWNELRAARRVPLWRRIAAQFADALVVLLVAAAVVSAAVWYVERESSAPFEALAILTIVILNSMLSLYQEGRAEEALAALRAMSAPEVTLTRDGKLIRVPSREVVPGDVMLVAEGDAVAADARLIETAGLHTLEAALTGESLPVEKSTEPVRTEARLGDRHSMLFSGTAVSTGHGRAVVTATGMRTELGKIAGMLEETETQLTPLQKDLDRTGKQLGLVVLAIAAVVTATLLALEGIQNVHQVVDVLLFGVALAVAAAPEGLAAVVTVVLSMGVTRMAGRGAIVRKLPAVETLGAATVIASDKTGTLTKNEMTVRAVVTAGQSEEERRLLLTAAALANNAELADGKKHGDPTETALLVAAAEAGLSAGALRAEYRRVGEAPFTSERKRMSTVHEGPGGRVLYLKGAPGSVIPLCTRYGAAPLTGERRAAVLQEVETLAGQALRTLAVAMGDGDKEENLTLLGLVGLIDPPRQEAAAAVATARAAGLRPIMITGDHPATAKAIAREVGIAEAPRVMTGADLDRLEHTDVDVFARVNPEHKLRIVQALQQQGAIVAMTGDGVNDAPALKAADIGVAMGITGTDVSKEAADLVLTDDNFATIVAAVEEGRAVFDNIRKFLRYLLSSNIGEVLTIFFGVVLEGPLGLNVGAGFVLPLLATQILWINLVTDGAPALALGADPASPGLMRRPPRKREEGVINARMSYGIGIIGAVMAAGTLWVMDASMPGGFVEGAGTLAYGRTMAFTTLVLFQILNAFNCRSDERSVFSGLGENRWLLAAAGLSVAAQIAVVYVPLLQTAFQTVPLSAADWLRAATVASSVVAVSEAMKWALRAGLVRVS
ncbi:MAG TPA: cation-translocating P-type ATPase [Bryobacteraceae bacterium]|nr:cation-translocating P-type ATPase [Bryobacteraceae bacterium]